MFRTHPSAGAALPCLLLAMPASLSILTADHIAAAPARAIDGAFFGYPQWNEVPTATIDRVEIVRGGGATLSGDYLVTTDGFAAPLYGNPFTALAGVRLALD